MSPTTIVQEAVFKLLSESQICGGRIYDDVPEKNIVFPYIDLSDDLEIENAWTTANTGGEITITIHVWSRYKGAKEAQQICDSIKTILDGQALSVPGLTSCHGYVQGGPIVRDPDGITRHGIVRVTLQHEN